MNQILFVSKEEKKDMKTIVKFFCFAIILFALVLVAEGTYSMIKTNKENNGTSSTTKNTLPVAEIIQEGDKAKIVITHDKPVDKVHYTWNQGQIIQEDGNGRNNFNIYVELPTGEVELKVTVKDIDGVEASYSKNFGTSIGTEDTQKPQIKIEDHETMAALKITVTDNVGLKSVKYKWNNSGYIDLPISEEDNTRVEKNIELLLGENTLQVIAIDTNNNEQITEKPVIAATSKPELQVSKVGNKVVIKATDESGMDRIEFTLNGSLYMINTDYETTVIDFEYELSQGEIMEKITAYNKSGVPTVDNGSY